MAKTAKNLAVQLNEPAKGKTDRKEVLRVAELDAPSASENKVLVKMLARPVNPSGKLFAVSTQKLHRCLLDPSDCTKHLAGH